MLITLVIIGVIAALTIPNLMQKYQEQTTVKKVQKFYSTLSNAFSLAIKDNGPVEEWGLTGTNSESAKKIYEVFLKPYFKIAKNCGVDNKGNCISNTKYKYLNDVVMYNYAEQDIFYKVLLDDGSALITYAFGNNIIMFLFDVNGTKNPNKLGVDGFYFFNGAYNNYSINKIVPFGIESGKYSTYPFSTKCKVNSEVSQQGFGCPAWVVYKGNMDYLHCDDLSWTGKDKCK